MKVFQSAEALDDLANIIEQGSRRFGQRQSQVYKERLRKSVDLISRNPEMAPLRVAGSHQVRVHHVGAHLIVYEIVDGSIRIVRFLHARQNLIDHI